MVNQEPPEVERDPWVPEIGWWITALSAMATSSVCFCSWMLCRFIQA